MSRASRFRGELQELFDRRTAWLDSMFNGRRPGTPRQFSRRYVDDAIGELQHLASEVFAGDLAKGEFREKVLWRRSWHPKRGKGWGRPAKQRAFNEWFDERVGPGPTIYVFWKGRRCLYVGKTSGNGRRISSHFTKYWFGKATRVDVYAARTRRGLSALECLAEHRFLPSYNRIALERRKWTSKCPMCEIHKDIEAELRAIFWPRRRG